MTILGRSWANAGRTVSPIASVSSAVLSVGMFVSSPMPPPPSGATISHLPSRAPADMSTARIYLKGEYSFLDCRVARSSSGSLDSPLCPIDDEFANFEACDRTLVEQQAANAAVPEYECANRQPSDREGANRARTNCHCSGGHRTERHAAGNGSATAHRRNFIHMRVDVRGQFGRLPQVRHRCGMAQHRFEIRAASPLSVVGHTHAIDASVNVGR